MSRQNKKERHRLNRQARQRQLRRQRNLSPFSLVRNLGATDEIQCFINDGWDDAWQASILVLRRMPGGGHMFAAFLVDFGVAGLKDAWGLAQVAPSEFHERFIAGMSQRTPMVRCDPAVARQLVAGSIRWAHDNGFRLPPKFERWTAVLGGIDDWRNADVSGFELEYGGSYDDLRKRLIGCSIEEFLSRDDVQVILSDAAPPSLVDDEEIEADRYVTDLGEGMAAGIRRWLLARGITPHPQLRDATLLQFANLLEQAARAADNPNVRTEAELDALVLSDESIEAAAKSMEHQLALLPEDGRRQAIEAMAQVRQFVASFPSNRAVWEFLGGDLNAVHSRYFPSGVVDARVITSSLRPSADPARAAGDC